jgi:NADH:ubiquinone oxidoreductase subunit F (NADH-binding)
VSESFLLPAEPIESLDAYLAVGGGEGLERAGAIGPGEVISVIRDSGLRGRGGAGFPTGIKWQGLRHDASAKKYVVCNAAEGEPGTFKDRALMRANPYQLIEGMSIAAGAVGASEAFIAVKASFTAELERLKTALAEMSAAGLAGEAAVGVVEGPNDYLFGEEKALLEVIEGNDPLPRLVPPYVEGLFAAGDDANPAAVNNVETLSNIPHIVARGAPWFRSMGTEESPGTMVFTVSGDVQREAVVELEMGTPLSFLVYGVGEGTAPGREAKAVVSGVSNVPLPGPLLETPLSFEGMRAAGSGLGSGGFVVYDDTACMARVGEVLSSFLSRESCGQCPPCKLGTGAITERFGRLHASERRTADLEEIVAWMTRVTDANRCGLGGGQQALARGLLEHFWEELSAHLEGHCPSDRSIPLPKLEDYDAAAGRFVLDGA